MAPIIKRRASLHSRAATPGSKPHSRDRKPFSASNETFRSTRDDKRRMKHSSLISRIEKSHSKAPKRRRPSKKLIANIESLADALPNTTAVVKGDTVIKNVRIKHKSLKCRPGALKKKEKLEAMEKERFSKNMAQMAAPQPTHHASVIPNASSSEADVDSASSTRWAALRDFIRLTMDRDE